MLLAMLALPAIAIILLRDLWSSVMLSGIFSLVSASLFMVMDAVDVAFTEAAVGAGVSTVLMLGTLAITPKHEKNADRFQEVALLVVCVTGGALIYGTLDMPLYGDPDAPIHQGEPASRYIDRSPEELGVPNMVTSLLASYRGYATLGETTVIFTAGIGVLLLIGRSKTHSGK